MIMNKEQDLNIQLWDKGGGKFWPDRGKILSQIPEGGGMRTETKTWVLGTFWDWIFFNGILKIHPQEALVLVLLGPDMNYIL